MNEANEDLEAELASLRPRDASPELRRRIADHQARSLPLLTRRRRGLALVSGLAAACAAAALLLRWDGGRGVEPEPIVITPRPAPPLGIEDSVSTLLEYQLALARSPEDLDALVARDAAAVQESKNELVQVRAFLRSDAELQTLLGDD